jgi:hypothetical protein
MLNKPIATMACGATAGRHKNSKQMHANLFTVPLKGRNEKSPLEGKLM